MKRRRLGSSGLEVSVVGLGCNNFGTKLDATESRAVLAAALEEGVTLLDTADSYGRSEEVLGEILRGRRDEVLLATKFGTDLGSPVAAPLDGGGSRSYIRRAIEASLRRLRTDYIDLYQLHWPDPRTPMAETLSTLSDLVHEGKVRYIGCSNLSAAQITAAAFSARIGGYEPLISAQNYYNLIDRDLEAEVIPACQEFGLGMLPYFPLALGLLAGRYRRGEAAAAGSRIDGWGWQSYLTDRRFDVSEALAAFAAARGVSLLEVAIGGLASQPAVGSVIAGASTPEQARANAQAGQWTPDERERALLDRASPTPRDAPWRHPVHNAEAPSAAAP